MLKDVIKDVIKGVNNYFDLMPMLIICHLISHILTCKSDVTFSF